MTAAKQGDRVSVHYVGTLTDGSEFDRSQPENPIAFTIGGGEVLPGFEQAIVGMEVGETRSVTIEAGEAYGEHNEAMVVQVPREQIPAEIALDVGTRLQATGGNGETIIMTVKDVTEVVVTVDQNHPLAGEDLTFALELVAIAA
tara:strand:- start:804 stop:1235 length:432 start_codon:yes stop_codon:yes gene_type:complete